MTKTVKETLEVLRQSNPNFKVTFSRNTGVRDPGPFYTYNQQSGRMEPDYNKVVYEYEEVPESSVGGNEVVEELLFWQDYDDVSAEIKVGVKPGTVVAAQPAGNKKVSDEDVLNQDFPNVR